MNRVIGTVLVAVLVAVVSQGPASSRPLSDCPVKGLKWGMPEAKLAPTGFKFVKKSSGKSSGMTFFHGKIAGEPVELVCKVTAKTKVLWSVIVGFMTITEANGVYDYDPELFMYPVGMLQDRFNRINGLLVMKYGKPDTHSDVFVSQYSVPPYSYGDGFPDKVLGGGRYFFRSRWYSLPMSIQLEISRFGTVDLYYEDRVLSARAKAEASEGL